MHKPFSDVVTNKIINELSENLVSVSSYPNPFNNSTTISYTSIVSDFIIVSVYNIKGEKVKILSNGKCNVGENITYWDGTDSSGSLASSGLYFVVIRNKDKIFDSHKITLMH